MTEWIVMTDEKVTWMKNLSRSRQSALDLAIAFGIDIEIKSVDY